MRSESLESNLASALLNIHRIRVLNKVIETNDRNILNYLQNVNKMNA